MSFLTQLSKLYAKGKKLYEEFKPLYDAYKKAKEKKAAILVHPEPVEIPPKPQTPQVQVNPAWRGEPVSVKREGRRKFWRVLKLVAYFALWAFLLISPFIFNACVNKITMQGREVFGPGDKSMRERVIEIPAGNGEVF